MRKALAHDPVSVPAIAATVVLVTTLGAGTAAGRQEQAAGSGDSQEPQAAGAQTAQPRAQTSAQDDGEVIARVEEKLAGIDGLDAEAIRVSPDDGMVALSGQVENILTHDLAIRAATTVRGVRAIDDNLSVRRSDHSDTQIEREVETALALDPATEHWEIDALVSDGQVTLRGSVESLAEKSLATRVAKGVRGVRGVENDIVIDFPVDRTDQDIAHDVTELLRWNTIVDAGAIEVEVEDDVVTLSGQVDSLYEKQLAERLAEVTGVHEVDISNLDVRWTDRDGDALPRTGQELQQAVRMSLSLDPRLEAFEPDIEVEDGVVRCTSRAKSIPGSSATWSAMRPRTSSASAKCTTTWTSTRT